MRFSSRELKDIVIAMAALALAFSIAEVSPDYLQLARNPFVFLASLLTVGVAFIGHEMSHKFVARRRGFWAEFRMWPRGILMALLFSLAGFVFAAPGAVYFSQGRAFQRTTKKDVGMIGIAGIVFNLLLLGILATAYLLTGFWLLLFAALINSWLAIFNLLPFGPLDGTKVLAWSPKIWGLAFLLAIAGFGLLTFSF